MSSTLPLSSSLNPFLPCKSQFVSDQSAKICGLSVPSRHFSKSFVCFTFSSSNSGGPLNYGPQEEARWLREEQRWLREEQRWIREETRRRMERETLLREIERLKLRVQELESINSVQSASVSETVANIAKLLQVLKEGELGKNVNRILESGSSSTPFVVEAAKDDEDVVREITKILESEVTAKKEEDFVVEEETKVLENEVITKKRATLRRGSEGVEVQAMQEALQKLGFYSGEEDIEFSSFSSGTERAVKTWQATVGVPEDGIMTGELLERLYVKQTLGGASSVARSPETIATVPERSENGSPITAITEISEVQHTVAEEGSITEHGASHHRVFLLGENRWEEPSRLSGNRKQTPARSGDNNATNKCLSCRGEGRLLCMECDGTGEPNIEPQFMEWVDEGAKCPYCEGLGYTICDVCGGKN